jgi:hypothetical protein
MNSLIAAVPVVGQLTQAYKEFNPRNKIYFLRETDVDEKVKHITSLKDLERTTRVGTIFQAILSVFLVVVFKWSLLVNIAALTLGVGYFAVNSLLYLRSVSWISRTKEDFVSKIQKNVDSAHKKFQEALTVLQDSSITWPKFPDEYDRTRRGESHPLIEAQAGVGAVINTIIRVQMHLVGTWLYPTAEEGSWHLIAPKDIKDPFWRELLISALDMPWFSDKKRDPKDGPTITNREEAQALNKTIKDRFDKAVAAFVAHKYVFD